MKMKKRLRLSAMTVFFAMLFGFAAMSIGTEQACAMEGSGSQGDPYQISTYAELKEFAEIVNGGKTSACAKLTADIDASSSDDWMPIGTADTPFRGDFDGQGHIIKGLSAPDDYSKQFFGLFGVVNSQSSVIKNVGLVDNSFSNLYTDTNTGNNQGYGGVVGDNSGTVENCYTTGSVSGNWYTGGVVGSNHGTVKNCYNIGSVNATDVEFAILGGVVGINQGAGTVENCYNTGDVSGYSGFFGGVVGENCGTITNCYNIGSVVAEAAECGGVVGQGGGGTITNCYYDKELSTASSAVAGADDTENVKGLTTEEMTGRAALKYMVFAYGTGETSPWMDKENDFDARYYPHLKGFDFDKDGKQLDAKDISADNWPPKTDPLVVETPTFSPAAGEFGPKQSIKISCATDDATIYYTTDGSDPTTSGNKYTEPITISDTTTIKAMAIKEWFTNSRIGSAIYTHVHKCDEWTSLDANQHQGICEYDMSHVIKEDHKWDAGKVTTPATEQAEGVKTYTCTVCKATRIEPIAKLDPTPASTPTPVPVPASTAKVSGTPMTKMQAKGKTSLVLSWAKVEGAKGYDIFLSRCNHDGKKIAPKKIKTIKGNKTFSWTKTGLKKGTSYKAYVKAYVYKNGKKKYVSKSPLMHAYTGGSTKKYTNAKSVTLKNIQKGKLSLQAGKTFKIKAKVNKLKKNKKLMPASHVATLRYLSTNTKVASVNKTGKIIAKKPGTCTIYVYAHNGVYKKITVTVKGGTATGLKS